MHSPEINKFLHHEEPLDCPGKLDDWIRCYQDRCTAQPKKLGQHFQLHCTYAEILRKDEYALEDGPTQTITFKSTSDYFPLVNSDYARVKCKSSTTSEHWMGVVIGVRSKLVRKVNDNQSNRWKKFITSEEKKKKDAPFNVLMFGFDSLSRNTFIRKLPKSYTYLVDKIGAHVLNGYNIVGDGTPQALIPILTGHTELELPETRKRKSESTTCDAYPMIWKDYELAGYVTAFNEDLPNVGTFTYRLNGFDDQPTDHYMRPYHLATDPLHSQYNPYCMGDRPRHSVFMNYTYQILASHEESPKFIFSFHGELSHDSINLIEVADDDLFNFFKQLNENALLENTILIVMSDHGNRFAEIRNTFQGKLEERLPFFSFAFPDRFKQTHSQLYANFVRNANAGRLVTPFDINRTLRHILQLTGDTPDPPFAHKPNRALSLFNPISKDRSCADAYIESHWCTCQHWKELKKYDNRAIKAALVVTEHINRLTDKYRSICASLQVETISWAGELEMNDDLIRFQGSSDRDGYLGSFAEAKKVSLQLYQVKLVTRPGDAIYEASVSHNLSTSEYRVDTAHISRVNVYGDQARCIYERDPELRKFCYCK